MSAFSGFRRQWNRGSGLWNVYIGVRMRPAIQGDDAHVVHTLIVNRHVTRHLQDLNTVVICLANSWNGTGEAACIEGMICPTIVNRLIADRSGGLFGFDLGADLLPQRGQGGQADVLRIDDQRCAVAQRSGIPLLAEKPQTGAKRERDSAKP